jgi:hypothetical protein
MVKPTACPLKGRLRSRIFYWFGIILMLKWKLLKLGFAQQHRPFQMEKGKRVRL